MKNYHIRSQSLRYYSEHWNYENRTV